MGFLLAFSVVVLLLVISVAILLSQHDLVSWPVQNSCDLFEEVGNLTLMMCMLSLLLQYDVVPRACVSSLAALRTEIEEHKEQVFTNNQLAAYLRDSGAITKGKALVGQFFKLAASAQVGLLEGTEGGGERGVEKG